MTANARLSFAPRKNRTGTATSWIQIAPVSLPASLMGASLSSSVQRLPRDDDEMLDLRFEFEQEVAVLGIILRLQQIVSGERADRIERRPVRDREEMRDVTFVAAQHRGIEVAGGGTVVGNRALAQELGVGIGPLERRAPVPDPADHGLLLA